MSFVGAIEHLQFCIAGLFFVLGKSSGDLSLISSPQKDINLTNYYEQNFYQPLKVSFLEYMIKLKEASQNGGNSSKTLEAECRRKDFLFSTYNAFVYVYICSDANNLEEFCFALRSGRSENEDLIEKFLTQNNMSSIGWCDGHFCEDALQLKAHCYNIKRYKAVRKNFQDVMASNPKPELATQAKYFENTVEDVAFCLPFSCPYWQTGSKTTSYLSTLYDCMPYHCRIAIWTALALDLAFGLFVVLANMVIIVVVLKTPNLLLTPHGYFSLSLAAADLVVGIVAEPCIVYNSYVTYKGPLSHPISDNMWYLNISGFFTTLSLCASLLSLIATSLFRFVAVIRPNTYWRNRNRMIQISIKAIFSIWIVSTCLGLLPIFHIIPGDRYFIHFVGMTLSYQMDNLYLYAATLCLGLGVIWTLTLVPYAVMRRKKKTRKDSIRDSQSYVLSPPSSFKPKSNFKKLEKILNETLLVVVIAFTISYMPLVITQLFSKSLRINLSLYPKDFDPHINYIWNIAMYLSSRIILANSFANCIIYNIKNKEFLNAVKKLFQGKLIRRPSIS